MASMQPRALAPCSRTAPHARRRARCLPASLLLWLAMSTVSAGCVTDAAQRGRAAREQAPPPLDLTGEAPWPAPYADDPLWRRAASGGDFERARLAQGESAAGLLAALALGGSLGRTALGALPYARDRGEVIARLCELALGPSAPTSSWLLEALLEAAAHAPRSEEWVDPASEARCAAALRQLAERRGESPEDRDRALGTVSALNRR